MFAALALVAAGVGLVGCPGSLDPSLTGPGTGGSGGGGGSGICDGAAVMKTETCSSSPSCHSTASKYSGLDLESAGVAARLLGKMPDATTSVSCGASTEAYLVPDSNPPDGLMIKKLNNMQTCGAPMPYPLGNLDSTMKNCIIQWAQAVTTHMIQ
jgi:hypothetical protein